MRQWEQLETYLFDCDVLGRTFRSTDIADDLGVSRAKASRLIKSYLSAQTSPKASTLFVLTRTGRTTQAVWHVGERAADARKLGAQHADDVRRRFERFVEPTLQVIAEHNPRALPAAQAVAKGIEASTEMLVAILGGDHDALV
jgi:hypothetical protein